VTQDGKKHAFRRGARTCLTVVPLVLSVQGAEAQTAAGVSRADSSCASTESLPARYVGCALWIDEMGGIRRGQAGLVIARPGPIRPIRLEEIVSGDSARWYARRYQRSMQASKGLHLTGLALSVGSLVYALIEHNKLQFPLSRDASNSSKAATAGFLSGIVIASGFSYPRRAREAKAKAIWWHNRDLLR
jgi:hypothetical protein